MEKTKYVSIWKNEDLWKRVRNIFLFLGFLIYIVIVIVYDSLGLYFYLIGSGFVFISIIVGNLIQNTDKEITEIKKIVFWQTVLFIIFNTVFFLIIFFTNNQFIAVIFLISFLILAAIGEVFKEKLRKSNNVFKYIYDDNPPLLSKRYFEETENFKIIITIIVLVYFLTMIILSICATSLNWDWGNIQTNP